MMGLDPLELIWPRLKPAPQDAQAAAREAALKAQLAAPQWPKGADAAVLSEAQRIVDAEAERRRSSDNKAAIYLAAIAAVLPLLASTETIFWDQSAGLAPVELTVWPMLATIIYLGAAGFWAVRVLRVSATSRVDVEDVAGLQTNAAKALAVEHLKAAYASRDTTNSKVSSLKLAHEFALRAAVAFAILLVTETAWTGWVALAPPSPPSPAEPAQSESPKPARDQPIASAEPAPTQPNCAPRPDAADPVAVNEPTPAGGRKLSTNPASRH